jgi:outer membrane immunogenic protein
MKIKTSVLAVVALAMTSIAVRVQAADFGGGVPYVVVNNWAGFYVGANLGFTHTNADVTVSVFPFTITGSGSNTQFNGGLLAGYNWQSGDRVFGIEGDINGLSDWDFIASIRARYGVIYGNWLYYGTIGVGFVDSGSSISAPGFSFNGFSNAGLAVGGGAETKINSRLAAGVEGLFYWFPDDTQNLGGFATVKTSVDVFSIRARLTYQFDGSPAF